MQANERDLVEMPDNIKEGLEIRPVQWIDEVLEVALTMQPTPRVDAEERLPRGQAGAAQPCRRGQHSSWDTALFGSVLVQ